MGTFEPSGSIQWNSVLNTTLEALRAKIIIIAGIDFIILILCIYLLFRSSKWILKWYGAQEIQRNEKFRLYSILEDLSARAEVKIPKMYSFDSEIPMMFTVGNGIEYSIAISTSMLEMFDEFELESLLAHEIGHIMNRDVTLNTITAFLSGLIMSFPDLVMWFSVITGFGQPNDLAPRFFRFIAAGLAAPPAAILVHLTNPAKKEIAADEVAIKLTQNPQELAKILEFLENYIPLQPVIEKSNPGHFHLFSTHTQQFRGDLSIFIYIFDTHPEIGSRVTQILSHSIYTKNDSRDKNSRVPGFFDVENWMIAIRVSLVFYLIPLFITLTVAVFAIKNLNFIIIGLISGTYITAVFLTIGIAAELSYRNFYSKQHTPAYKIIILSLKKYFVKNKFVFKFKNWL